MYEHVIEIKPEAKPVKQRYYSISRAVQSELYGEIDRMLNLGMIEVCKRSEWSSPGTVVKKSDGRIRFCLDARVVNSFTIKDTYPLPLIEELLSRLENTKYITKLGCFLSDSIVRWFA